MHPHTRRLILGSLVGLIAASGAHSVLAEPAAMPAHTPGSGIAPTSYVMIVNRDSNDIAFMDIKTRKIIKSVFLGNNVNPHMVMMSPDGRYVVTGGTRANKAYITRT